jgi:hypothetical protein
MCLMEDQLGLRETKQMMMTSEEKYIFGLLIKLVKSLTIALMRLIWNYFLVCRPSTLQTHLHLLMHRSYVDLLILSKGHIFGTYLMKFELQLDIADIRTDVSFEGLENLVDLSVKLVQTKRHKIYDLVYKPVKLVLLLPVATVSVERTFSAMTFIKSKLRNKMGDILLDDCLLIFIERDVFFQLDEDDIIKTFMTIRNRGPKENK